MDFTSASGIVMILLGLLCIWQGWKNYKLARASHSWIQVPGTITHVKLRKLHDPERNADYEALITYSYAVGKLEFSSSTIAIGKESVELSAKGSLFVHERFPLHSWVQVYYDPANPAQAVLEPGKEGNGVLVIAIGIGLVVYGGIQFS